MHRPSQSGGVSGGWQSSGMSTSEKLESMSMGNSSTWVTIARTGLRLLARLSKPSTYYRFPASSEPAEASAPARPVSRTASYDGLRGIACLIVFNFHFLYPYTDTPKFGWGANRYNIYLHQWPIICLLVRGRAMVTLFFAVSGYVLSYGFLAAMRERKADKAFSRISSLAVRRWMRLYVPATITTFAVCVASYWGAFDAGRHFQRTSYLTGTPEEHPPKRLTWYAQWHDYCAMWWRWANALSWDMHWELYDPHTWTIPAEFRCSMALFVLLLAGAGLRQNWRLGVTFLATMYALYYARWDFATFIGGALVADLHQAFPTLKTRKQQDEPTLPTTEPEAEEDLPHDDPWTILKWCIFFAALYLLSFPNEKPARTPGYRTLTAWIPTAYSATDRHYHWSAISSNLLLWSIEQLPTLQALLSSPIPQYLGKISFAFYLVQGPLLHSIGFAIQPNIFEAIGYETVGKWCLGLFVGWTIMLVLSLAAANVFYRFVDMPLVKLASWLEGCAKDHLAFKVGREEAAKAAVS